MIRAARRSLYILLCAALPARASPGLSIEADLAPASVYVGQEARLSLRLMRAPGAPGGMLVPPDLGDVATLVPLGPAQLYDVVRAGVRYTAVERDFVLVPRRAGRMKVPSAGFKRTKQVIFVPGRRDDGARPIVHGPASVLEVRPIPSGAARPWLPARSLSLEEHWSRDPQALAAGEPVTRTFVIRADGLAAARLPRLDIAPLPGLLVRADRPELSTTAGPNGLQGESIQRFVLVPTGDGKLTLPPMRVEWWDVQADARRSAGLPSLSLILHPAPVAAAPPERVPLMSDRAELRWIVSVLLVLAAALLVWHLRRQIVRDAKNRLREACRLGDPRAARDALTEWWTLARPREPVPLLSGMSAGWDGRASERLAALDAALYAGRAWDGEAFWQGVRPWLRARPSRRAAPAAARSPLFRLQAPR